jgi:hypothetical protein
MGLREVRAPHARGAPKPVLYGFKQPRPSFGKGDTNRQSLLPFQGARPFLLRCTARVCVAPAAAVQMECWVARAAPFRQPLPLRASAEVYLTDTNPTRACMHVCVHARTHARRAEACRLPRVF